jgi:hypothetical protein
MSAAKKAPKPPVSTDPEIVASALFDVLMQKRAENPQAFAVLILKLQVAGIVRAPLAFLP